MQSHIAEADGTRAPTGPSVSQTKRALGSCEKLAMLTTPFVRCTYLHNPSRHQAKVPNVRNSCGALRKTTKYHHHARNPPIYCRQESTTTINSNRVFAPPSTQHITPPMNPHHHVPRRQHNIPNTGDRAALPSPATPPPTAAATMR